jgi:hypothetical protein
MEFELFINGLNVVFVSCGFLVSLMILSLICTRIRPLRTNIPLILTCNTYLVSLISSLIFLKECAQTIYGILHSPISFDSPYCHIDGYFIYISFGNVFYSLTLQAIFRLLRIVYYQKRSLRSLRIFTIAIVIQWILVLLINLPFIFLHDFEYIPSEYRCQISYTNLRASIMVLLIEYVIPSNIMFSIYIYIIRYIRRTNRGMANRQQQTIRRDMIVIKQTLILFTILQIFSTPLVVLWLLYAIVNYLTPLSYQLQSMTVAFSQVSIPIVLAFSTPQIREQFKRRRGRVHPLVRERIQANQNTGTKPVQRF